MNPSNDRVFAIQCPNPRCRKFMLVEEHERDAVVTCLLCKTPIRVAGPVMPSPVNKMPTPLPRA